MSKRKKRSSLQFTKRHGSLSTEIYHTYVVSARAILLRIDRRAHQFDRQFVFIHSPLSVS